MKRILLLGLAGLVVILVSAPTASAFGTKDVIKMTRDGVADSLIIQKIEYSGKTFRLDADDIHALQEGGVSDEVISAMLRTESQDRRDDYYGYGYDYPPYYYPYSRVYLGFGFYGHYGHYGHYGYPYYGGYRYYPRYRSYYSNPYSRNHGNQRYRGSYGAPQHGGGGSGTRQRQR